MPRRARALRFASVLFLFAALVVAREGAAQSKGKAARDARARDAKTPPSAQPQASPVTLLESKVKPTLDYEAEVYAGVALDDSYARERGLSKGLVSMVFEKQRRGAFRVPHEKIKRLWRFAVEDGAPVLLVKTNASPPKTKIDVLETDDGVFAIETVTSSGGIFTTSDVYTFAKGTSLDQRLGALSNAPATSRERLRRALSLAK